MWNTDVEKHAAFESEAVVHIDSLYNSALKLTYNEEDAKDLIQETYFKAYRFFGKFEPGTSCKAWLYKILKNTFINKYRKKVKQPEKVDYNTVEPFIDLIKDHTRQARDRTIDEELFDKHLSDEVSTALKSLTEDFRMVIILADIEGFSYQEIAEIMECPIGTIRSRLSRARKMMFKILVNYAKTHGYHKEEIE